MFFLFVLFALSSPALPARAGAWVKEPGAGYAKLGSATFVSDVAYDDDGVLVDSDPFVLRAQTLYLYGEVGIGPRLMVVGYVPWVASTNQRQGGDGGGSIAFHTLGVGDAQLSLQFGIVEDAPLVVSARGDIKLPLYEGAPSVQGRAAATPVPGFPRSAGAFPALGDGQVDATLSLLVGAAFPFDGFFT